MSYIILRNVFQSSRKYYVGLFKSIGQYSLELYLLQHHIWLSSHAKTLVSIVPGFPLVNFVIATALLALASREAFIATKKLQIILLPHSTKFCIVSLGTICTWFSLCLYLVQRIQQTSISIPFLVLEPLDSKRLLWFAVAIFTLFLMLVIFVVNSVSNCRLLCQRVITICSLLVILVYFAPSVHIFQQDQEVIKSDMGLKYSAPNIGKFYVR